MVFAQVDPEKYLAETVVVKVHRSTEKGAKNRVFCYFLGYLYMKQLKVDIFRILRAWQTFWILKIENRGVKLQETFKNVFFSSKQIFLQFNPAIFDFMYSECSSGSKDSKYI